MKKERRQVESRNETFAERQVSKIWQEQPHPGNPYIADRSYCHGYDLLDLMAKRSFVDVFYLLFKGELPSPDKAELLEALMIALINPGPRHPSTRAAMNAGVGKTDSAHILPISLSILGGNYLGAGEIEGTMRFLHKSGRKDPAAVVKEVIENSKKPAEGDWHPVPGFGSRFGGIDEMPRKIANQLCCLNGSGKNLAWADSFAKLLSPHNLGWLSTGVAAAAFADLGFNARSGAGLFQLLSAPGLLAHGLELVNKPLTAMPFPKDQDYTIEYEE